MGIGANVFLHIETWVGFPDCTPDSYRSRRARVAPAAAARAGAAGGGARRNTAAQRDTDSNEYAPARRYSR